MTTTATTATPPPSPNPAADQPCPGDVAAEEAARLLNGSPAFKVLRRLAVVEGPTSVAGDIAKTSVGVVVDCETTGLDVVNDVIVELAMRRFRYDYAGRILKIDRIRSWREDPGRPLVPEVVRLTGLTDADLAGQTIDEGAAVAILRSATCVIAHNAAFDRKMIERRLPAAAGLPWACSCREIDWPASGFDGRALGWLLAQAGFFHDGHRAASDVDAVVALLRQPRLPTFCLGSTEQVSDEPETKPSDRERCRGSDDTLVRR